MLDAIPDDPQLESEKTAKLANRLLACCYKAKVNGLGASTALGLVAEEVFRDIPEEYLQAWIATLRSHLGRSNA